MKNFTSIAIIFGLFTFISCGTTMDAEQDRSTTMQIPDEGGTTVERPLDARNPNRTSFSSIQEQQVQQQQQRQDYTTQPQLMHQYNQNMYADLSMSDEQIRQFEARDSEYMRSTTNAQHANQAEMLRQRNENLRGILNHDQYTKYQQWVINNPPKF